MLEYGSCKLYSISTNNNEYKKIYRTLSGDNKMSVLDDELINDALAALNWICANDVDKPVGALTYTQMLNMHGGIECDLTIAHPTRCH